MIDDLWLVHINEWWWVIFCVEWFLMMCAYWWLMICDFGRWLVIDNLIALFDTKTRYSAWWGRANTSAVYLKSVMTNQYINVMWCRFSQSFRVLSIVGTLTEYDTLEKFVSESIFPLSLFLPLCNVTVRHCHAVAVRVYAYVINLLENIDQERARRK
jgi:hypothetical protein